MKMKSNVIFVGESLVQIMLLYAIFNLPIKINNEVLDLYIFFVENLLINRMGA